MTTESLKTTQITDLDAVPPTKLAAGKGAKGASQKITGFVTTTSGKTTGSTYLLARVPRNAVIKSIVLDSAAMGGSSALDFGVYYSDATSDGTSAANQGAAITAAFFASAVDVSSAVRATDITNESGTYTIDKRNKELWDALAVAADPGGFLDIVATSTATITTGALFGIEVTYTTGG
jgi:hypothetical protein